MMTRSISEIPGGDPGAELWPNTSISADGRYVVFRTTEARVEPARRLDP